MLAETPPPGFVHRPVKYGPYSPSRLIVAKCAYRFFGQYVRKDRSTGASFAADRGSAIHHVLSLITKSLVNKELIKPSQVTEWVSESIGLFPAAYESVDLVKGAANAYIANPSPYLSKDTDCEKSFAVAFYEEDSLFDDATPDRRYVPVPYSDEDGRPNQMAFFGGKLDQINVDHVTKTVVILDHKSTPNMSQNPDVNFQMGAYAWLVSLFYPGYQIKTVIHFCNPFLNTYKAPYYWSPMELKEVESEIHAHVGAIEHFTSFPTTPGTSCDYCHLKQECPDNLALMEQRARGKIDLNVRSFADLPKLADALRTLGVLYDEVNKALKQGIETYAGEGGVSIDGMWVGFKTSDESVKWAATDMKIQEESRRAAQLLTSPTDPEGNEITEEQRAKYKLMSEIPNLEAFLVKYEVNPNNFKEWQNEKFKNLWKIKRPGMMEQLKEYIVTERATRYGIYKR
jgi:hypothetical protein